MPFETLSPRLQDIAARALAHCRARYGANGLKIEEGIDKAISWRPSFVLRPAKFRIVAVEVEDNPYPEALKIAAHDIGHFDFPISVYQACSLEAYQADPKQAKIKQLRKHGFGILTIDDDGEVAFQNVGIPLLQHISSDQFNAAIAQVNPELRVALNAAYEVYETNEGQGLQQAGQIVEGLVQSIAMQAAKRNVVTTAGLTGGLADTIDALYQTNVFKSHRAALGGARDFIREYRNPASHAPKNPKEAADKIRKCKTGFLDAISVCRKLREVARSVGYRVRIYAG